MPLRIRLLAALTLALAAAAAEAAAAKEATRATLEDPAAIARAAPGERIAIVWTLSTAARLPVTDPQGRVPPHPFGASGVYARVRGKAGGAPVIAAARPPEGTRGYPGGRYLADVTVPRGGIASLAIGLEGYRFATASPPVRADMFFPIDNDPFAGGMPAAGAAADEGPRWALLGGAVVLALALLLVSAGRARARSRRAPANHAPGAPAGRA